MLDKNINETPKVKGIETAASNDAFQPTNIKSTITTTKIVCKPLTPKSEISVLTSVAVFSITSIDKFSGAVFL